MAMSLYWVNAVALTVGRIWARPWGKALRQAFEAGVARRARRGVGGVVRESVAIDLQKVGGVRVRGAQCKDQWRRET